MTGVSDVCAKCKLCCGGTLFTNGTITEEEKARLGNKGSYSLVQGELKLDLGCTFFSDEGRCTVYDKRPKMCADYICSLLNRVRSKQINADDAMFFVDGLVQKREALQALCSQLMPEMDWPIDLVTARGTLRRKIHEYEQAFRPITPLEDLQIETLRRDLIVYVRLHFEIKFIGGETLDPPAK